MANGAARIVAIVSVALVLLAAARLWCVNGLLRRVTIDGPSMAPAYCGPNYLVKCGDCGFVFRCDAEHVPVDGRAACPNCGFADNPLAVATLQPAEQVLIDRWPVGWRRLQRGEVVACRAPGGELTIKRVAALPGELPSIRSGELYDGERLIQKSPAELHRNRLLVHDHDFLPQKSAKLPPRWQTAEAVSAWRAEGSGFSCERTAASIGSFDWLTYVHLPGTANEQQRATSSPVTDNDSFNQGETRRALNVVNDVMLTCRLRVDGSGKLAFSVSDGGQRFEAEIEPGRHVVLRSGNQTLLTRRLAERFATSRRVEFGLCDGQLLLTVNGRRIIWQAYQRASDARVEVLHPLAIGSAGTKLFVDHMQVWRDAYYLDPQGLSRPWQAASPLAEDEYFLLGDNQPVSIDSRQWGPPGVRRSAMLGIVYKPFWRRER